MNRLLDGLKVALCLYIAAVLQTAAAYHMDIFGARPDFLLLTGTLLPLFLPPVGGTVCGFFAGALHGWVTGVSLTAYALVRMAFGYAAALFGRSGFEIDLKVAVGVVAAGSFLTQCIVFFVAPPADKAAFFRATIGTAAYNAVLAVPFFVVARRVFEPRDD